MPRLADCEIGAAARPIDLSPAGPPLPPLPEGVRTILHDWMAERAPGWLAGPYFWLHLRLTGTRCLASGCGRLLLLHTPRQLRRCYDTPLGIGITLRGWLLAKGMEPAVLDAWCEAYGLDPGAVVQPVSPANVA
jgi:hypothetical protein